MRRRALGIVLTLGVLASLACSQAGPPPGGEGQAESIADLIDQMLSPVFSADRPGVAVIAATDGEVVFRRGYGSANLELGVAIEPDMVFRVASITKEFTAALVMQLVERGIISLEDEITEFLPDYPVQGHKVTIAHLLSHTSGVKNFTRLPAFQDNIRRDHTVDETIAYFANEPFDFVPGDRYSYSSSGYILLGAILEEVTGKTYEELLRENIFDVIGLNSACVSSHDRIIPRRVSGYSAQDGRVVNSPIVSLTAAFSSGSLMMSVDDLATWDEALYGNQLLSDQSKEKMWSPFTLSGGRTTDYGLGWMVTSFLGHKVLMHDGSIDGFLSTAIRLPEEHIFVAVLTNSDTPVMGPNVVAKRIMALMLGIPEKIRMSISRENLSKYTGDYIRRNNSVWRITAEDGHLFLAPNERTRWEILPESETSFFFAEGFHTVTFELDSEGAVINLVLTLDTGDRIQARKQTASQAVP
jgi:CubicO group peptidase (beta-lactamase class C family)